jgi:cyclohexyl-isocyanide hydratase
MTAFNIGLLIFPDITQLDFTGPLEVFSRLSTPSSIDTPTEFPQAKTHIVAKTALPVVSDRGHSFLPSCTFDDCPSLDLICVAGGFGVADAIADAETLAFVRRKAGDAKYVTSVCVGAFVLGAAGLLKGRRATTHWAYTDLLPMVGAKHENGRIVQDGHVITAAGVSAGIDFAFQVVAELAGAEVAKAIQLAIEYDPAPPFNSGHPDKASEAAKALMVQRNEKGRSGIREGIERLGTL